MAIVIGSNFSYNGFLFLDERQGLPQTAADLKNWSVNVPEGFEVYLPADGEWYVYKSTYNETTTGHFKKRNQGNDDNINRIDGELDAIRENIDQVESTVTNNYNTLNTKIDSVDDRLDNRITSANNDLNNKINITNQNLNNTNTNLSNLTNDTTNKYNVTFADTFNDLLQDSSWNINGKNYAKVGVRVTVVNDGANNGVYYLKASDYKTSTNWVKLLDRNDLIVSGDNNQTTSSDTNIYTAARADEKFTRRDQPETVTEDWKFNHIEAETSDIKDLPDHIFANVKTGVDNMLRNTSFAGEYDTANFSETTPLNDRTILYSQPYEYWKGEGTWTVVEDPESVTGFSVTLDSGSTLSQTVEGTMISGESYVISYKAKGSIVASIDGQTYSTTSTLSDGYQFYEYKFQYSGASSCTVVFTGTGSICEPKLERGTISTTWFPSTKDTDPVANLINEYEYLRTSFKFYNGNCASGLLLKEIIQVAKYIDGKVVGDAKAGLSGVYNNDGNVFIWSGGDYASANKLMGKIEEDPNYMPTDEELQNVAKFAVTCGGTVYLNARGKFRGYYESKLNGLRTTINEDGIISFYNENNSLMGKMFAGSSYLTIQSNSWPNGSSVSSLDSGCVYMDENGFLKVKQD